MQRLPRPLFVIICLALSSAAWGQPASTPDPRPNIVFAFADDWGRYASAYREANRPTINDVINTPVFDELAKNGVLFWDAHVSAPSCSPSRTAVLTGRHFFRNGSGSQLHSPWAGDPADDPVTQLESYHTLLEKAGYHTGVTYKTHVASHLFVGRDHHYNKAGNQVNTYSRQVAKGTTAVAREQIKQQLLEEVRDNFRSFLDAGKSGQPFCWYFSPTNPHRPWQRESAQAQWGINPDDLKGRMPAFMPDVPTIRQDMADYLGECMAFDAQVGVIVDELKKQGLFENTILVISGDHGAPGFPRGKTNLVNFGTQVPLVIHWPKGIASPGRRIDNPTSLIDLAPTYLEAIGLPVHPQMDGHSLYPILQDPDAKGITDLGNTHVFTGRERHHLDGRAENLPYPSRAVRTHNYLLIRNFKPDRWPQYPLPLRTNEKTDGDFDGGPTKAWFAEHQHDPAYAPLVQLAVGLRPPVELYDLIEDPDQMRNLADSPEHQAVKRQLSDRLMKELTNKGDPRVVGEGDGFDRPPYLTNRR